MMGFNQHVCAWKSLLHEGLEHVIWTRRMRSISAVSVFIGMIDGKGVFASYSLTCDQHYQFRNLDLHIVHGNTLRLWKDEDNQWWLRRSQHNNEPAQPLPEFAGCLDIDIMATPFTNTLPIRRVAWEAGQSREFKMLYISVPDLTLSISEQRYTCLEKSEAVGVFRFELVDGSFSADLPVDADGLVLDYPGLFKRLWAS